MGVSVTTTATDITVSVNDQSISASVGGGIGPPGKDGSGGVSTLNGLTGTLTVSAGANVTVTTGTAGLTIAAPSGGASTWNDITGKPNLVYSVAGRTGTVTLTTADIGGYAAPSFTSLNGLTGTPSIVAGANVTVTTSASSITVAAAPGGVTSVAGATGAVTFTATGIATSSSGSAVTLDATPVWATPSAISSDQNDYAPGSGDVLRISSSSTNTLNITGFSTSSMSKHVLLINVSTHTSSTITVQHQNTGSVLTNRVITPTAGNLSMPPNGGSMAVSRDATDSRWRIT